MLNKTIEPSVVKDMKASLLTIESWCMGLEGVICWENAVSWSFSVSVS
jgi:hypothetical protein